MNRVELDSDEKIDSKSLEKSVRNDNKLMLCMIPPLFIFFFVFYKITNIESLQLAIIISLIISFFLSIFTRKDFNSLYLCKIINYGCSLTGYIVFFTIFYEGNQNFFLVLILIFYIPFFINSFIFESFFGKDFISTSSLTLIKYSPLPILENVPLPIIEEILKNEFFNSIKKSEIDRGFLYETAVEDTYVNIFVDKTQKIFSVCCFDVLYDKIIETSQSKGIMKLIRNIFEKIFNQYSGVQIRDEIDSSLSEIILKRYTGEKKISRKIIMSLMGVLFFVTIMIARILESENTFDLWSLFKGNLNYLLIFLAPLITWGLKEILLQLKKVVK